MWHMNGASLAKFKNTSLKGKDMKARIAILGSFLALSGAMLLGAANSPSDQGSPGVVSAAIGKGMVTVTVYHSVTKQPLWGMPVSILREVKGGQDTNRPLRTDKNGVVVYDGLGPGMYQAIVLFNNNTSNVESFIIKGDSSASVILFFNPDIN